MRRAARESAGGGIDLRDPRRAPVPASGRDCQSRCPPSTDSNCVLRTAAAAIFRLLFACTLFLQGRMGGCQWRVKSGGTPSGSRAWSSAGRSGGRAGSSWGNRSAASARSSHSILAASRRMLILMAARQAMEAQMPRRRSSSEAPRSSPSAISRISKRIFSRSAARQRRRRGLHRDGAVAEGLGLEADGVQLVGDARVVDLLLGR